jgi:site-specific recombinase XerD
LEAQSRKLSPGTVTFYEYRYRSIIKAMGDKNIKEVTIHDLRAVVANSLPKSAIKNYIAIRKLFKFLIAEGILDKDPSVKLSPPKQPKTIVQPFSTTEIAEMLKAAKAQQGWTGIRDTAVFATLIATGIRRFELCGLKESDVDLTQGTLKVLGKGNKERMVPLSAKMRQILLRYTIERAETKVYGKPCEFFFRDRTGNRLTPNALTRIIRRLGTSIGIKAWTHRTRHSFASIYMSHDGADVLCLKEICGWSSLAMALVYVKPSAEKLQRSMDNYTVAL